MCAAQSMLRGDSLGMTTEPPGPQLVERANSMVMIEPGAAPPEAWAQDMPSAMRTPSLEARQVSPRSLRCQAS